MNLILAYDTETTGLPLFKEPSEDPRQPHIVQLGAVLIDTESRETLDILDVIIRPDGWTIPDEVAAIHGITTEQATNEGIGEKEAVNLLLGLWLQAKLRVGHNETFDARIIRIALKRHFSEEYADQWKAGAAECTARLATPICNLPPTAKMLAAKRRHPKTPNLGEAYQHFTGKPLENAHSAMADVLACLEVYWAIKDQA